MISKLLCYIVTVSILNFNLTYGYVQIGKRTCSLLENIKNNFYCHECKSYINSDTNYKNCLNMWLDLDNIKYKVLNDFYGSLAMGEAQSTYNHNPTEYQKIKNCWLTDNCEISKLKAKNKLADYKNRDKKLMRNIH